MAQKEESAIFNPPPPPRNSTVPSAMEGAFPMICAQHGNPAETKAENMEVCECHDCSHALTVGITNYQLLQKKNKT